MSNISGTHPETTSTNLMALESVEDHAGRVPNSVTRTYAYDVFLSCHESDRTWVETDLLNPLRAAGLMVTWEWDFAIGVDKILARSEAVNSSRHTIVILSKAWCSSSLTQDDALSARFLDPNANERKILPLLGEKCDIFPELLRRLTAYDFSDVSQRQATLPKLLSDLGQSRQTVTEVMSNFAQLGIRALIELMMSPEVRIAVKGIEAAFVTARDEIDELTRCKQMHEFFHRADNEFQRYREEKERLQLLLRASTDEHEDLQSETEEAWDSLDAFINCELYSAVHDLMALAGTGEYRPEQILWGPGLERAISELAKASENRETKPLNRASERLSQIFGEWPVRFDRQLLEAAQRLKLSSVVSGLGNIRETAFRFEFQKDVAARLDVFFLGIAALSELGKRVQDLVACHNCLQFIDDIMRTLAYPCTCDEDVEKVRYAMPDIEPTVDKVLPLSSPSWGPLFHATRKEFCDALQTAPEYDIETKTIKKISSRLGRFRSSVLTGFTQVDLELLGLCKKLQRIGQDLSETIRSLQRE